MTDSKAPQLVGVISSRTDFQRALRMGNPPDLFELRLDAMAGQLDFVRNRLGGLAAPFIITARHPREGGANDLSSRERQHLLLAFLPQAKYVDIELRSARSLAAVRDMARANGIGIIGSFHDFTRLPDAKRLDRIADAAQSLGADILKIAARLETPAQFRRLLDFFERQRRTTRIAVMGIGRLGRFSRLEFARRGCPVNYAHLGKSRVAGQLSLPELRRALP
jgi:3-dehydroquinate dehydratase-1